MNNSDSARFNRSTTHAIRVRSQRLYKLDNDDVRKDDQGRSILDVEFGLLDAPGPFDQDLNSGPITFTDERYFSVPDDEPVTLLDGLQCRDIIIQYNNDDPNTRAATITFVVAWNPDPSVPLLTERSLGLYSLRNLPTDAIAESENPTRITVVTYIQDDAALVDVPIRDFCTWPATRHHYPSPVECQLQFSSRFVKSPDGSESGTLTRRARFEQGMHSFVPSNSTEAQQGPFRYTYNQPLVLGVPSTAVSLNDERGSLIACPVIDYSLSLDCIPNPPRTGTHALEGNAPDPVGFEVTTIWI